MFAAIQPMVACYLPADSRRQTGAQKEGGYRAGSKDPGDRLGDVAG